MAYVHRRRRAAGLLLCLALVPAPGRAIVNGMPPGEAQFRREFAWAVALRHPGSDGVCTGQLISPTWVLTAAHCTSAGAEVLAGEVNRNLSVPVRGVEAITHPAYDPATGVNDVGLIRLEKPLAARPVPLITPAEAASLIREGARAVIAGWGKRSPSAGFSDVLVVSDVELRDLRRAQGRIIYYDAASGPCGGDSGGPLLLARPGGGWVLAGVASRVLGDLCAKGGGTGVYVDVAAVRDFIVAHVSDLPP